MSSYVDVPGNFLGGLSPIIRQHMSLVSYSPTRNQGSHACKKGRFDPSKPRSQGTARIPDQNLELPSTKRRIFTEVSLQCRTHDVSVRFSLVQIFLFNPCECRVVPLKSGVSLYALNPTTRKVTLLKGTRAAKCILSFSLHTPVIFIIIHLIASNSRT